MTFARQSVPIRQIARRTRHSRKLVRQIVRGERTDVFRTRHSTIDTHLPLLDAQRAGGCHNCAELWCRLRRQGFRGSSRVVSEWATRRRQQQCCCPRGNHRTLVEWPDRRTDHQAQAHKSPNVCASEDRPASRAIDGIAMNHSHQNCVRPKIACCNTEWQRLPNLGGNYNS